MLTKHTLKSNLLCDNILETGISFMLIRLGSTFSHLPKGRSSEAFRNIEFLYRYHTFVKVPLASIARASSKKDYRRFL